MMKTYPETVDYLYGLQMFGMKMGLENIRRLCRALGNPQDQFDSIHIAGTNGKGSTAAMIESVLRCAGYRTGLYTSPHLIDFTERIQVCGRPIDPENVVALTDRMRPLIDELKATFFEATTALAFACFAEKGVRLAVVETGLGGRLDATNIISPAVSVITPIALDHTEHLGRTLGEIAREKAGILKPFTPAVFAPMEAEPRTILAEQARSLECPVTDGANRIPVQIRTQGPCGLELELWFGCRPITLSLPLWGGHQAANAATAAAALEVLKEQGFPLTEEALVEGFQRVHWPGRFQVVERHPPLVLDVAHNPAGAAVLAEAFKSCFPGLKPVFVLGIMADKNYTEYLRILAGLGGRFILCRPNVPRAAQIADLAAAVTGLDYELQESVASAVDRAMEGASATEAVVITGSFHTVGEAMAHLNISPFPE